MRLRSLCLEILVAVISFAPLASAQAVRTESVLPQATDPAINNWLGAHLSSYSTAATHRNLLFLYLHGQGGTGSGATELLRTAAEQGFHGVGLTYANDWSPFNLCAGDPNCPEAMRLEILDGTDRTTLITVSRANSIESRLIRLLGHLDGLHPGEGWMQYVSSGSILWDRVVLWGHSQGGGNAGIIAKHHRVARACTSAPAADGGQGNPAAWWAQHATPADAYFGFCHVQDALATKVAFWNALGLGAFGGVVDIASTLPPFAATHQLSTSIAPAIAGQYHNSVVADAVTPRDAGNVPLYKPVWQYMMTAGLGSPNPNGPTWNDVVFATVPTLTGTTDLLMDIYDATSGQAPHPIVVWIHGGGWQSGSHDQVPATALALRADGYVVASIGYRLSGQAIFPAQIHDCKGAIRFLRANASTYGIDPVRLGVWGSSAGGHLVALLGTSGGIAAAEGDVGGNLAFSSLVQGVADYFGPADFFEVDGWHTECGSPEAALLGACLGDIQANRANPAWADVVALAELAGATTHVTPDDPPFHIAHGDADTTVWPEHSQLLHAALLAEGVESTLRIVPGAGHGLPASEADFVHAFFDRVLAACAADLDGDGELANGGTPDGGVDINDLVFFLAAFEAGHLGADLDDGSGGGAPDQGVDIGDLIYFLTRFEAGC